MDILWQYNNPPNPSAAAIGPQAYDHHLYYRLVCVPLCLVCNQIDISSLPPVALAYVDHHPIFLESSQCVFDRVSPIQIPRLT